MSLEKKHKNIKASNFLSIIFRWIFIAAFSYVLLYPIAFIVSNMLKTAIDYTDPTVIWIPKEFTFVNIERAFNALNFIEALKNTFYFEIISAAIEVGSCAVAAYGLARFDFAYKKILVFFMILTILVPAQMTIIPTVLNYKDLDFLGILGLIGNILGKDIRLNILDTPLAFYLPSIFAVGLRGGLFIFIYLQFFKGLPKELEEAAWIDGASPIKAFLRIIVPSSGVAFVTVSIFSFIWHWNDYYLALLYTSSNRTLSVMLGRIFTSLQSQGYYDTSPEAAAAALGGCFLFIIIPLVVYLFAQRKFVQSIDRVGIVG